MVYAEGCYLWFWLWGELYSSTACWLCTWTVEAIMWEVGLWCS